MSIERLLIFSHTVIGYLPFNSINCVLNYGFLFLGHYDVGGGEVIKLFVIMSITFFPLLVWTNYQVLLVQHSNLLQYSLTISVQFSFSMPICFSFFSLCILVSHYLFFCDLFTGKGYSGGVGDAWPFIWVGDFIVIFYWSHFLVLVCS